MSDRYRLNPEGHPIPEPDLLAWARWFEKAERRVRVEKVGDASISTVFLGLDHSFGRGEPLLWETMIFGGKHDGYQERYCSKDAAIAGHLKAMTLVKESS